MEHCKDCEHWYADETKTEGTCEELYVVDGRLMLAACTTIGSLTTPSRFGCPVFSQKPKGPFKVCGDSGRYYVSHYKTATVMGYWGHKCNADTACKFLNDEWERRE